jgi:hypothetical protein
MRNGSEGPEREQADRADTTDPAVAAMGATGVPVQVEPDAAVVSLEAVVPPDLHEETAPAVRPAAAVRAIGGRLRGLLRGAERPGSGRGN